MPPGLAVHLVFAYVLASFTDEETEALRDRAFIKGPEIVSGES
jgi:hypothetical protein